MDGGKYRDGVDDASRGKLFAIAKNDKTILVWDVARNQALGPPLSGHDSPLGDVEFSPDGKILLSAGQDGSMILWDTSTLKRLLAHGGPAVLVTTLFRPDGSLLVSGSGKLDGPLMLWDVRPGQGQALGATLPGQPAGIISSLDFSSDGKNFAAINKFGTVVLWDVATRQPFGSFLTSSMESRIQFSPDGKVLAVIGMDNKVTLWDVATRRPLAQPISGENGVALSKNFETIASIGNDGILLRNLTFLYDASRQSWQELACERANRNLTRAEWKTYFGDKPYRATCPRLPLDEDTTFGRSDNPRL